VVNHGKFTGQVIPQSLLHGISTDRIWHGQSNSLIHPQTAAEYGIRSDGPVVIETAAGRIIQTAQISDTVKPGVIAAACGWWFPEEEADCQFDWQSANYNMLTTSDRLGKEFGSPDLKGIPCRIRAYLRRVDGPEDFL
jgi:anaerobic selenocysteine-containing dehydrogenase